MITRSLRRSLTDFKRHPWLHVVSVSTIAVALVILGGFFLCYRNFESIAEKTSPRTTGTVYLKEALAPELVSRLKERVLALENVVHADYKTKASVVEELQTFLGGAGVEAMPGSEIFPDVLEIEVKPDTKSENLNILKTILTKFPEVSEVDFSEDWLQQYRKARQLLTVFGILLLVGVLVGCSFIIANFMGMRHQSRKAEIDIVRLIGAHQSFVLSPFLWEGIIEGVVGATLALGVLYLIKVVLSAVVTIQWASLLGVREWLYLSFWQLIAVVMVGIAMAFCGSIAVFLRFQEDALT